MELNALNHEYHKIMVDAKVATVRNRDTDVGSPPPAYTPRNQTPPPSIYDGTLDDDDDDDDDEDDEEEDDLYADPNLAHPINGAVSRSSTPESTQDDTKDGEKTIHMNNKLSVLGSQNIITASPLDGMRWTASILAILNGNRPLPCQEHQHQQQQQQQRAAPATTDNQPTDAQSIFSPQARGPVNILIDCSVHVVGDRNIVGCNLAAAAYGALAAVRGGNAGAAAQVQTHNGMPHATPATAPTAVVDGTENDKPAPPAAPLTPPAAANSAASALPRPSLAGAAPARNSSSNSNNNNQQPTHANGTRKRLCVGAGVPAASASTATVDARSARADAGVCGGLGREDGGMSSITRKRAREEDEGDDGDGSDA